MIITGIGSRQTPADILKEMEEIGRQLAKKEHWLRSGHAQGADWAFEKGAGKRCIVYMPWRTFNQQLPMLGTEAVMSTSRDAECREMVRDLHPNPDALSDVAWKFMIRNLGQVLGISLDSPSNCVVCWTPDGEATGGTGLAIRLAVKHKIPVYNMFHSERDTAAKILEVIA